MSPETSGPVELHDAKSPTDDGWPEDRADEVSAQITQSNGGQPTVTAIQDPAQAQSGGGLP
jgi:hypothetical protein